MAEFINKAVAIDKTEVFCDVFDTKWTDEKVLAWIGNLPTVDAVPVVRCKDCEYRRHEFEEFTHEVVNHWCDLLDLRSVEDDEFCCWAIKKR